MRLGAVDDRRAAYPAEAAAIARRCFVIGHQILALNPLEVGPPDASAAPKRGPLLLAAKRAMTVQRPQQRPIDFELNTAAQAAYADHGHPDTPLACSVVRR